MFKIVDKNSIKMKNSTCTFASRRTLESAINMTHANKNDVLWYQMIKSNIKSHHNKSELIHHQNYDDKKIKNLFWLYSPFLNIQRGYWFDKWTLTETLYICLNFAWTEKYQTFEKEIQTTFLKKWLMKAKYIWNHLSQKKVIFFRMFLWLRNWFL